MRLRNALRAACLLHVILPVLEPAGSQVANWESPLSSLSVPGRGGSAGSLQRRRRQQIPGLAATLPLQRHDIKNK